MSYKVAFVSLGCAKNLVNTEQMMDLCRKAGYEVTGEPEGADVAVLNTCGFIESAKSEAIDNILELARLKDAGKLKKLLVAGCLSQRYPEDIRTELPEVDGMLGTGSYTDVVSAVEELMAGERPEHFGDIHHTDEDGARIVTTPPYTAYLKIAEGCSNGCAFCIIPKLRGRYRSRSMESLLREAQELADRGVKELIVIAQDITRYGLDLGDGTTLSTLLRELCKLPFHWIRLHYLYPEAVTDELIETIAGERTILHYLDIPIQHCNDAILSAMRRRTTKAELIPEAVTDELIETIAGERTILHYLDIPIQHCNDAILSAMRRRTTKAELIALFDKLRAAMPDVVIRTSLICGLPGETDEAFEELCEFLREQKLQRAGVFQYSREEGTLAARMEDQVDDDVARRRVELAVDLQSRVMDQWNEERLGETVEVLCEGFDTNEGCYVGRTYADSVDIDGRVLFTAGGIVPAGEFVYVRLTGVSDGDLTGEIEE